VQRNEVSKVSGTCAPLGLANKVASPASNRVLMAAGKYFIVGSDPLSDPTTRR